MGLTRKQQSIVVIVAAILMVSSSVLTLVFTGALKLNFGAERDTGHKNITFTDANMACEQTVEDEFSGRLKTYFVDSHSSRYDHNSFLYKIFLEADVVADGGRVAQVYVVCFVDAGDGNIDKLEYLEKSDAPKGQAIRKGGDKFIEWPQ
ncbi:hypothetical protein [Agaribacterium haliotis]|uniref:hypothetical protein n=1 Tax=Agaribacterium haliotis TaxID=2013869 RepID=UPI000BB56CBD|nr:hypothetical protein [Agaribacterium haliotis]